MKFHTVWAVYFSATGTTKKVVHTIASRIAEKAGVSVKTYDFTLPTARETSKSFSEGDLVVFATPVYAGRVPNLLLKYVTATKGNGAIGVPVVLYGNRSYDDALVELRNIMEEGGFRTVAAAAFVGEHSFSRTLAKGRPDAEDLGIATQFADQIVEKVAACTDGSSHQAVYVKGNDPIHPYYKPKDQEGNPIDIRKVKPETTEDCVNCKRCAKACPLGSINIDNVKEVSGICMKCNACVKICPKNAKYFTDPGFLCHKEDLELRYAEPRKAPELFL